MNPYEKEKRKILSQINECIEEERFKYRACKDNLYRKAFEPNFKEELIILETIKNDMMEGNKKNKIENGGIYIEYSVLKK